MLVIRIIFLGLALFLLYAVATFETTHSITNLSGVVYLFGYFAYILPIFVAYFPFYLEKKAGKFQESLPAVDKIGMYFMALFLSAVAFPLLFAINAVPTETMELTGGVIGSVFYGIMLDSLNYNVVNILSFLVVFLVVKLLYLHRISYLGLIEGLGGRVFSLFDKDYHFEPTFRSSVKKVDMGSFSFNTRMGNDDKFSLEIEKKPKFLGNIRPDKFQSYPMSGTFKLPASGLDGTKVSSPASSPKDNATLDIGRVAGDAQRSLSPAKLRVSEVSNLYDRSVEKSKLDIKSPSLELGKGRAGAMDSTVFDMVDFDFSHELRNKKEIFFNNKPPEHIGDTSEYSVKIKKNFDEFYKNLDTKTLHHSESITTPPAPPPTLLKPPPVPSKETLEALAARESEPKLGLVEAIVKAVAAEKIAQANEKIAEQKVEQSASASSFPFPSVDLLFPKQNLHLSDDLELLLESKAREVERKLSEFGINAEVQEVLTGPVITQVLVSLSSGVKVSKLQSIEKDLARALSSPNLRILDLVPNTSYVGIEIDSIERKQIMLANIVDTPEFRLDHSHLILALGLDIAGGVKYYDLTVMPHLLIAGTTGSGKSIGLNTIIMTMLFKHRPDDLRFIFIDPKRLELSLYNGLPHLLHPVIYDLDQAISVLKWCIAEMDRRYKLLSKYEVRSIAAYNEKIARLKSTGELGEDDDTLPHIVIMIDELADLMLSGGRRIEELIIILAQKARASGIHLILATQRPSVDVITGLLKANIPSRVSYMVSTKVDSRTILDTSGAEKLLGKGDLLFMPVGVSYPERLHGPFVGESEITSVVEYWKKYPVEIEQISLDDKEKPATITENNSFIEKDEFYDEVYQLMLSENSVLSISAIQRRFSLGFNRAAKIIDQLEADGLVSKPNNRGKRVLTS